MRLTLPPFALLLLAAGPPAEPAACPTGPAGGLAEGTTCYRLRDTHGAFVTIARPANPHGGLVVHTHGGPRLDTPTATTTDEDLLRFREFVAEGWMWVQSSRRRGGFGVAMGAEDTENARALFVERFGQPGVTIAHGQSYGALVTAALIERRNAPGPDGRSITSGSGLRPVSAPQSG